MWTEYTEEKGLKAAADDSSRHKQKMSRAAQSHTQTDSSSLQ